MMGRGEGRRRWALRGYVLATQKDALPLAFRSPNGISSALYGVLA